MHSALPLCSTLLVVLPFVSQARQASVAPVSTTASSVTAVPSLSSSTSSGNNPVSTTAAVSSAVSSAVFLKDLLTQLVNAEQQTLIATHYLANLKEKAVAVQNTALITKLQQAQDAALAEQAALAQAQALAKPKSVTKDKAGSAHQVRQAVLPDKVPTCNLVKGDKDRLVALKKAFTYKAVDKGSKDSVGVLLKSAVGVYNTLKADIATAKNAPYIIYSGTYRSIYYTSAAEQLRSAESAAELALGSLKAIAIDNEKRPNAFVAFFVGATVIDFFKYSGVTNANERSVGALEMFGTLYGCGPGF